MSKQETTPYRHGDVLLDSRGKHPALRMYTTADIVPDPLPSFVGYIPYIDPREALQAGNALRPATDSEITEWNEGTLHANRLHYSRREHRMKRWFHPFDEVIARNWDDQPWRCDIFSHYTTKGPFAEPYKCVGGGWAQCMPYVTLSWNGYDRLTDLYIGTKKTPSDFTQL